MRPEAGKPATPARPGNTSGTLVSSRLERLFDIVTPSMAIYAVTCQEARADEPRIAAFRTWLRAEAAAEGVRSAVHPQAAE